MKHIIDDADKNKYEAYTKQEVLNVIQEAISSGTLPEEINGLVLTFKNPIDNQAYKIAFCTQAKYNELESGGNLEPNCVYYITDDTTLEDMQTGIQNLGNYILNTAMPTFSSLNNRVTTLENKRTYQHTITYTDTVDIGMGGTLDIKVIFNFFSDYNIECTSMNDLEQQLDEQKPYLASGSKALYLSSEFQGRTNAGFVVYENGDINVYYDDGVAIDMRGTGYITDSITRIV